MRKISVPADSMAWACEGVSDPLPGWCQGLSAVEVCLSQDSCKTRLQRKYRERKKRAACCYRHWKAIVFLSTQSPLNSHLFLFSLWLKICVLNVKQSQQLLWLKSKLDDRLVVWTKSLSFLGRERDLKLGFFIVLMRIKAPAILPYSCILQGRIVISSCSEDRIDHGAVGGLFWFVFFKLLCLTQVHYITLPSSPSCSPQTLLLLCCLLLKQGYHETVQGVDLAEN